MAKKLNTNQLRTYIFEKSNKEYSKQTISDLTFFDLSRNGKTVDIGGTT